MNNKMNWIEAKKYLDEIRRQYTEIGISGMFVLRMFIDPLFVKYEKGDRSKKLYNKIMALK